MFDSTLAADCTYMLGVAEEKAQQATRLCRHAASVFGSNQPLYEALLAGIFALQAESDAQRKRVHATVRACSPDVTTTTTNPQEVYA